MAKEKPNFKALQEKAAEVLVKQYNLLEKEMEKDPNKKIKFSDLDPIIDKFAFLFLEYLNEKDAEDKIPEKISNKAFGIALKGFKQKLCGVLTFEMRKEIKEETDKRFVLHSKKEKKRGWGIFTAGIIACAAGIALVTTIIVVWANVLPAMGIVALLFAATFLGAIGAKSAQAGWNRARGAREDKVAYDKIFNEIMVEKKNPYIKEAIKKMMSDPQEIGKIDLTEVIIRSAFNIEDMEQIKKVKNLLDDILSLDKKDKQYLKKYQKRVEDIVEVIFTVHSKLEKNPPEHARINNMVIESIVALNVTKEISESIQGVINAANKKVKAEAGKGRS